MKTGPSPTFICKYVSFACQSDMTRTPSAKYSSGKRLWVSAFSTKSPRRTCIAHEGPVKKDVFYRYSFQRSLYFRGTACVSVVESQGRNHKICRVLKISSTIWNTLQDSEKVTTSHHFVQCC